MPPLKNLLTAHLEEVDESYLEHLTQATKLSSIMLTAGTLCLVHAVFPFVFTRRGGDMALEFAEKLKKRREKIKKPLEPKKKR